VRKVSKVFHKIELKAIGEIAKNNPS
jgi:hypothetical protein